MDDMLDRVMDSVEQYANQRLQGESFETAQAATELRSAFERYGIDVDEVRYIRSDPSLMYYDEPEDRTHQLATIGLVAAKNASKIPTTLAVTGLEDERTRAGRARVDRDWIDAYANDELSKTEFCQRVVVSWSEIE